MYVHCKAGRTRSATVVAAYLIQVRPRLSHLVSGRLFFRTCIYPWSYPLLLWTYGPNYICLCFFFNLLRYFCDKINVKPKWKVCRKIIVREKPVKNRKCKQDIKTRLHQTFAFASPININDGCKRFLQWNIQKNAKAFARCKLALRGGGGLPMRWPYKKMFAVFADKWLGREQSC